MTGPVLTMYNLDESQCTVTDFGNGLINHTWKIHCGNKEFLLQKINRNIFKSPEDVMDNLQMLSVYFSQHYPDYLFVAPLSTIGKMNYLKLDNNYFRLFPFIENSHSVDTVKDPVMAFEASRQFGKFTGLLSSFDPKRLH